jgi:hypothetical protein
MVIHECGRLRRLFSLSAVATFIAIFAPHAWGQQGDATVGQGGNIQGVLDTSGVHTVCIDPGTYRLTQPLKPHTGQTLRTTPNNPSPAILDGSQQINTTNHQFGSDDNGNSVITSSDQPNLNLFAGIPALPLNSVPCQTYSDPSGSDGAGDVRCQYSDIVFVTTNSGDITMPRRYCGPDNPPNHSIPTCANGTPNGQLPTATYAVVYARTGLINT